MNDAFALIPTTRGEVVRVRLDVRHGVAVVVLHDLEPLVRGSTCLTATNRVLRLPVERIDDLIAALQRAKEASPPPEQREDEF